MTFVRYSILTWALVPIIIIPLLVNYQPSLFTGDQPVNAALIWTFVGLALSYYGLLFSLYAALEVRFISNKYLFKLRSPDLSKALAKIAKNVSAFGAEPSKDLRSQRFVSEASVTLRAVKRMKNKELKKIAVKCEVALKVLTKNAGLVTADNGTAGDVEGYWEFFQKMVEMADECRAQLDDVRAVQ